MEYDVRDVDDVLKLLLQVTTYMVKICTSLIFTMYRESENDSSDL